MNRSIIRGALATALTAPLLLLPGSAFAAAAGGISKLPVFTASAGQAFASPGGASITFQARLSAASGSVVTVHYATKNGTATASRDYAAASGTLRFPKGRKTASITIRLRDAVLGAHGAVKTFSVVFTHPVKTTLATHAVTGKIFPDVYVAPTSDTFGGSVINPAGTTAYFTVPTENQVDVLNLRTGTFGKPILVGSDPTSLDITPDGKTLYVCDTGGQTLTKINLTSLKTSTIVVSPMVEADTYPFSIAIMDNDHALLTSTFDGSGFGGSVYDMNLKNDSFTVLTSIGFIDGQVTEDTPLTRSANYAEVNAFLGDLTPTNFYDYSAATGNVVTGAYENFLYGAAVSGNGSTLLLDTGGSEVVAAADSGALLGTINNVTGSSVLNAAGTVGYTLEGNFLFRLNLQRFLVSDTITLPEGATGYGLTGSANGRLLVAETGRGAMIIQL